MFVSNFLRSKNQHRYHVRSLDIETDLHSVLEADITSFQDHFEEVDVRFLANNAKPGGLIVAVRSDSSTVDGFAVTTEHQGVISIGRICVHADCRRRGAATAIVDTLIRRLNGETHSIRIGIPETMQSGIEFFRSRGFFAESMFQVGDGPEFFNFWYRKNGTYRYKWRGQG